MNTVKGNEFYFAKFLASLEKQERLEHVLSSAYTPLPLLADAYTVSGDAVASLKARQRSVYNLTNRVGPLDAIPEVAFDNRMVLYGLSDFCMELAVPFDHYQIDEAAEFMNTAHSFGGPLYFPEAMWRRVVDEFGGMLPIRIEALPEGSTFWPNEPVIQVTSLGSGFGELAAHIEAVMLGMVSVASARATITRHWLERMRCWVRKYNPTYDDSKVDSIARWMIHDFGMRASSGMDESILLGKAHLLVFHGTDTFNAAYAAWKLGAKRPTGTSILALAHRIVQGHDREENAYRTLYLAAQADGGGRIGSYVADCYDFHNAVTEYLVPLAKQGQGIVVARPDSGDYLENVRFVVNQALANNLFELDEQGRPKATTLRFIQGDSMNPEKVDKVLQALADLGVNPTQWGIFGVGGYLRNRPNRDLFSSAYKLAAMGEEDEPVVKLSDTPAKLSIPGPSLLLRSADNLDYPTVLMPNEYDLQHEDFGIFPSYRTYYDASKAMGGRNSFECFGEACFETFDVVSSRVIDEFDRFANVDPRRHSPLSPGVKAIQQKVMQQHGR